MVTCRRSGPTEPGARTKRLWFGVARSVTPRINHFRPFPVSVASSPTRGWPTATGTQPAMSLEAGRPDAGVSGAGLLPGARRKNPSCLVRLLESSGLPGLVAAAGQPLLCPHMASSACLSSLTGTSVVGHQGHSASSPSLIPSAKTMLIPFPHEATF